MRLDSGLKVLQATVVELHAMGKRQETRLLTLLQWSQTQEVTLMNAFRRTTTLDNIDVNADERHYLSDRTRLQTLTNASLTYPPPLDRRVGKKVLLPSDPSQLQRFGRVLWYKAPGNGAPADMLITMYECEVHRSAVDLLTPWSEDGKVG